MDRKGSSRILDTIRGLREEPQRASIHSLLHRLQPKPRRWHARARSTVDHRDFLDGALPIPGDRTCFSNLIFSAPFRRVDCLRITAAGYGPAIVAIEGLAPPETRFYNFLSTNSASIGE